MASVFEGKKIVLGVTGSIAAYKSAQVCSHLVKMGAIVYPVMTPNALNFLGISTLSALSGNETIYDQFRDRKTEHISLAHSADAMVIAPATANTISKLATGICDNFLTTTALAATCPVLIAPAMNESMYTQQSLQENIRKLKSWGKFFFAGPAEGRLACGEEGKGKMVEPDKILDSLSEVLSFSRQLEHKTVLVTAGGTREYIDSVRYISNASSGKMGHALAREAKLRGAKRVILVTSAPNLNRPLGVETIEVESSMQMRDKVLEFYSAADVTIMAAAVSDIIPGQRFDYKLKKKDDILSQLSFKLNQNILQLLSREKKPGQVLIGFAAETELTEQNILEKFKGGNIDMIVANDISKQGMGIGSDYNQVILVSPDGSRTLVEKAKKNIIARKIWANIIDNYL